jgi:hypothetical protein
MELKLGLSDTGWDQGYCSQQWSGKNLPRFVDHCMEFMFTRIGFNLCWSLEFLWYLEFGICVLDFQSFGS